MKSVATVALSISVACICVQEAHATTRYVQPPPTGSDLNPGTEASPYATIGKGVSVLVPGDTVLIKAGTYSEALRNNIPSGTSWSAPVTVAAYPGATVTLQPSSGYEVIRLVGQTKQYIVLDGLVIDAINVTDQGVYLDWFGEETQGPHHIRVQNVEIKNAPANGIDMRTGAAYCEFLNLNVHNVGTGGSGHGIYVRGTYNLVERCRVYDNRNCGIQLWHGSNGHNTVRRNKVYNNGFGSGSTSGTGIAVGSDSGEPDPDGNLVYDNLVWASRVHGLMVAKSTNTKFYNNTVYKNGGNGIFMYGPSATSTQVKNNIVWSNNDGSIVDNGSNTTKAGNLESDPAFIDPANADFKLRANSPAIDQGVTLADVPNDFDGVPRPQGLAYDIGAYEYDGSPGAPSGLVATSTGSLYNQVNLSWTDGSSNESEFKIERKQGTGGTYSQIGTAGANATTFTDTTAEASTTYYYRVRATNANGNSAWSNEASVVTPFKDTTPPVIDSLVASPNTLWSPNHKMVAVTIGAVLHDLVDPAPAARIVGVASNESIGAAGDWEITGQLAVNLRAERDGPAPGRIYTITVEGRDVSGNTTLANVYVTVPHHKGFDRPAPAVTITAPLAEASVTGPSITVEAEASDDVAIAGVQFLLDGSKLGTECTVVPYRITWNSTLTSNGSHTLTAVARDSSGNNTSASIAVNVANAPSAPTGLTASTTSYDQVNLTWNDNSDDETGFKIERKAGSGGTYTQIGTASANATSYNDTTCGSGTTYYYQVRAWNDKGDSGYSPPANATTDEVTAGRQGHWKFNETSGTNANDETANSNDGAMAGGPEWTAGKIASGLRFDGGDDVVNCQSGDTLDNLAAISVCAWIKADTMGGSGLGRIVQKGLGGNPAAGWRLIVWNSSNPRIEFAADYATTDLTRDSAAGAVSTGVWRHVTATWTGSATATNAKIYVDGIDVSARTGRNGAGARGSDGTASLYIGNASTGSVGFDGVLDDVRVYNRVLTANEILAIHRAGL